ncbi:Aldehyde Dehydrogenase [Methanohalobium evestigatum Z-7303]|uniref:Aldehyde Dehydrogenase n=1 Tax=Methanohalobium evestigatum (strain ATCC BAA-1072 / DSM 3721 / NBRC 107634 / OCM 161 / Z-7303) TaxID=644295 RepID=D7EAQ7_METEZ|nr:NAD-dependent succinate-semialdehyde dehydrogenase [Methanohalobium evestigatum]ADI75056.1 Aldehyde Dehydrogenase [Methanohalobium evestigatum Z-7303]
MDKIVSINPATEKVNKEYNYYSQEKVDGILKKSNEAFEQWKNLDVSERAEYLNNAAAKLRERKEELAPTITKEMGKPIRQSESEIEKCAWVLEHFAEKSKQYIEPEFVDTDAETSGIVFEPLGTILTIMPWNFPFWQALRVGAAALAGGNVILLKHSSHVPMCALEIEGVFRESGFPEGVYQTLLLDGKSTSSLIGRDEIAGVSFTGSTSAGRNVAEEAGKNIKKCVLELGGSDPFIVLDDADLDKAAEAAAAGRFTNTGQSCVSAKRFIVMESIADEFISKFVNATRNLTIGDPMDENTDIGPLVSDKQIKLIEEQVNDAVSKGAEVLLEGGKTEGKGFYYSPVILTNVSKDSRVITEETFGPVAPIITVSSEKEAIKEANDTQFGLGANIWTEDREKAVRLTRDIEAGNVSVNSVTKSDPRLPFGGIKKSGVGRELSRFGFYEFMNIKSMKVY